MSLKSLGDCWLVTVAVKWNCDCESVLKLAVCNTQVHFGWRFICSTYEHIWFRFLVSVASTIYHMVNHGPRGNGSKVSHFLLHFIRSQSSLWEFFIVYCRIVDVFNFSMLAEFSWLCAYFSDIEACLFIEMEWYNSKVIEDNSLHTST